MKRPIDNYKPIAFLGYSQDNTEVLNTLGNGVSLSVREVKNKYTYKYTYTYTYKLA